jgi:hypothetical protein
MNTLSKLFLSVILCFAMRQLGSAQTRTKWELGFHIQASNTNALPNAQIVNPQNVQWIPMGADAPTTSILGTLTNVKNSVLQYGVQIGSIRYGNGINTFDILPSTAYPQPPNGNLVSNNQTYWLVGIHGRINVFKFIKKQLLKLPEPTTEPRFKTFLQVSLGSTFRQNPFDRAMYKMGWFPTFATGPNGEIGILNRDYHDQAFFNGFLQTEMIAQYRFSKRFSLNARMFLHAPFGNPLFKFHNEYIYNNQLIGSATVYGPGSSTGFSMGLVYNIYRKQNKN